jgi:hypothetical protein
LPDTRESLGKYRDFPLLKSDFPCPKSNFPQRLSDFLQRLSAFLNGFPLLQQVSANLLLKALVTSLAAANKKPADTLARNKGSASLAATPTTGMGRLTNKPFPGFYCWTQGH